MPQREVQSHCDAHRMRKHVDAFVPAMYSELLKVVSEVLEVVCLGWRRTRPTASSVVVEDQPELVSQARKFLGQLLVVTKRATVTHVERLTASPRTESDRYPVAGREFRVVSHSPLLPSNPRPMFAYAREVTPPHRAP